MNTTTAQPLDVTEESDPIWRRSAKFDMEQRPMTIVRQIVVNMPVDVMFFVSTQELMVVIGKNRETLNNINTHCDGHHLFIEQGGFNKVGDEIEQPVSSVSLQPNLRTHLRLRLYSLDLRKSLMPHNEEIGDIAIEQGRCIVAIGLPPDQSINVIGSDDVSIYNPHPNIKIKASAQIKVFGEPVECQN